MYSNIVALSKRYPLILASGSPRRRSLLSEIGCQFATENHEVEETMQTGEQPYDFAQRLAQEKALAVHTTDDAVVFGFDTIVVINGHVLGKPGSENEAHRMLRQLSGKDHTVCTAVALAQRNKVRGSGYDLTTVRFREVTDEQISEYVRNGEPMDKAGAYGIQGMGGFLVDSIEGNLDTVIGLPRNLLDQFCAALLEARR